MAATYITVNVQDNPKRDKVATAEADATIIESGLTDTVVEYQIRRRDRQGGVMVFTSNSDLTTSTQVVFIDNTQLKVILPFRQEFQVRVRAAEGTWSNWVNFKTRDKRYQSPDAITKLSDDGSLVNTSTAGNATLNITNGAKATVVETAAGATVTNTDNGYNDTTSITYTAAGATVVNAN